MKRSQHSLLPPVFSTHDFAAAQQRAPGNESITQADLRADLFFLAGDAMRGRLTDTNENRATADYIRARFERAGLKPAAGNSFFHNYNLMTATLGDGNSLTHQPVTGERRGARVEERPGVLSAAFQRQRHRHGAGGVRRFRHLARRNGTTTITKDRQAARS